MRSSGAPPARALGVVARAPRCGPHGPGGPRWAMQRLTPAGCRRHFAERGGAHPAIHYLWPACGPLANPVAAWPQGPVACPVSALWGWRRRHRRAGSGVRPPVGGWAPQRRWRLCATVARAMLHKSAFRLRHTLWHVPFSFQALARRRRCSSSKAPLFDDCTKSFWPTSPRINRGRPNSTPRSKVGQGLAIGPTICRLRPDSVQLAQIASVHMPAQASGAPLRSRFGFSAGCRARALSIPFLAACSASRSKACLVCAGEVAQEAL